MHLDENLTKQIIRCLQWPADDLHSPESNIVYRRPSVFWVYKKFLEAGTHYSRIAIFNHYDEVLQSLFPRFLILPEFFRFKMMSVLFKDELSIREDQIKRIGSHEHVELVQRGLGVSSMEIFPILSINILYRDKTEFEKTLQDIETIGPSLKFFYSVDSYNFFSGTKNDIRSFRRNITPQMKNVIISLLKNPLTPMNEIAESLQIKRSTTYKLMQDISSSGLFKIEFSIKNPSICGMTLGQVGISCTKENRNMLINKINGLETFKERALQFRWSFSNVLYVLFWSRNYSDMLEFNSYLNENLEDPRNYLIVWGPSTQQNIETTIQMINAL